MKIMLCEPQSYLYDFAGSKINRLLLEGFVELGHECIAFAPFRGDLESGRQSILEQLRDRGIPVEFDGGSFMSFKFKGVEVHCSTADQIARTLDGLIKEADPDVIIVADDVTQMLLKAINSGIPTIHVTHAAFFLPFGPYSDLPDPEATAAFHDVACAVSLSGYMCDYIERWSGKRALKVRFPAYGKEPVPNMSNFGTGRVTFVNPSAIKGIKIFLSLASLMPKTPFAAVPTWSTTQRDINSLSTLENVSILRPSRNIDDVLANASILLVPSWLENLSTLAIEAQARGIPTVASNAGGLPEAKFGVEYVIELAGELVISRRDGVVSEYAPPQEAEPWRFAVSRLMADRAHYEDVSSRSRDAAREFIQTPFQDSWHAVFDALGFSSDGKCVP